VRTNSTTGGPPAEADLFDWFDHCSGAGKLGRRRYKGQSDKTGKSPGSDEAALAGGAWQRVCRYHEIRFKVAKRYIDINILDFNSMMRRDAERTQRKCKTRLEFTSGWCSRRPFTPWRLMREESLNFSRAGLGDSDFRVLEVLLHKRPLPVNTIGPKVWLTPGSISVAVDRLEKKALVKRKNTDDRRVRLVELTAKGRALITKTFREHAAAMEEAAGVLSKEERLMLLRLLKKLGKGGEEES
jgi:MarR family 2-MHQ and catechol resistance regulon transcriptional repressor